MNWDDARYFLAVARDGQMLGASRRLAVSQAMLSRRIASLEAAAGVRLLERTTRGCFLTEHGQIMREAAEQIESAMLSAADAFRQSEHTVSGTVRIGAPDGFGANFLAPRLKYLRAAYPELQIQLVPMPRNFSLSQREADLAVVIGRPDRGRLRRRHLTDYSLGLYASRGYLAQAAIPRTVEELNQHVLVGYVEDLIYTDELNYAAQMLESWRSHIEVSTAVGQLEVVRSGGGIGVLHDFMAARDADLVRILPGLAIKRSYWTVWHENMRSARQVAVAIDFINDMVRESRELFEAPSLESQ